MHILFLTDNFPPEVNAPASRTYEHCREWVKAGAEVTVITTAPNFPKGKVFEGYRNRLWSEETIDGIRVIRVWTYITANEGFVRRTLDYVSFMIAAIIASFWVRNVSVVVATSPQFFTAIAGYLVGSLKRRPWVFELRDLWPESIKAVGAMRDGWMLRRLERLELFLYRRAARIVSVTQSFRQALIERGISGEKIAVVTNGVDLARFSPRPKPPALESELDVEGAFVAGYIGTHGMAHGLETLLEAAAILEREAAENAQAAPPIRLLLLGDGALKAALKQRAADLGLSTVTFLDTVPKEQVADFWALLDVTVIHLRKTPLFKTVIPSKLFEAMASGVPVIHAVEGESAEIVAREGVGLKVEPGNPEALAAALREAATTPARLQRFRLAAAAAARRYDRKALAMRMLNELSATAGHAAIVDARPISQTAERDVA